MNTIANNPNHVYPIFDKMLGRSDKEQLLKQRGLMVWFTGLRVRKEYYRHCA